MSNWSSQEGHRLVERSLQETSKVSGLGHELGLQEGAESMPGTDSCGEGAPGQPLGWKAASSLNACLQIPEMLACKSERVCSGEAGRQRLLRKRKEELGNRIVRSGMLASSAAYAGLTFDVG